MAAKYIRKQSNYDINKHPQRKHLVKFRKGNENDETGFWRKINGEDCVLAEAGAYNQVCVINTWRKRLVWTIYYAIIYFNYVPFSSIVLLVIQKLSSFLKFSWRLTSFVCKNKNFKDTYI